MVGHKNLVYRALAPLAPALASFAPAFAPITPLVPLVAVLPPPLQPHLMNGKSSLIVFSVSDLHDMFSILFCLYW